MGITPTAPEEGGDVKEEEASMLNCWKDEVMSAETSTVGFEVIST